jgi:hypothetical protein
MVEPHTTVYPSKPSPGWWVEIQWRHVSGQTCQYRANINIDDLDAAIKEARQRFIAQSYSYTDYYVVRTERVV